MAKRWLVGVAVVLGTVTLGWLLFGPFIDWVTGDDLDRLGPKERIDAVTSIRGQITTLLGSAVVVGTLVYTARKYALDRDKQVTDRFNAAVSHLGSDDPTVRAGGVRALERILADSPGDHVRVVRTLADFLRQHTRDDADAYDRGDVQAAVTAQRDRPRRRNEPPLDLRGVKLQGADLRGCRLSGADLGRTDLTNTDLTDVHADGANLDGATIAAAVAKNVSLRGARMTSAVLTGIDLRDADLTDANLRGARLQAATLAGATLTGADLVDTDLCGVDLTGVHGLTSKQLRLAKTDARTRVPTGIDHPMDGPK
ncbi:MAG TPA: pentapeptide repeat-containing protein [Actinokineospora sp.]|nr:pentapeptide repeat-containing protein [Actinokineospora sp.]